MCVPGLLSISSITEKPPCGRYMSLRPQLSNCAGPTMTVPPRGQGCSACSLHPGNQLWSGEILSTTSSRCSCTTPRNYHKMHETSQVPGSSSTPPTDHGISSAHSGGPNLDDTPHKKWGFPGSSCLKRVWMVTKKWRGKWKRRTRARFWAEGSTQASRSAFLRLHGGWCFVRFSLDRTVTATAGPSATGPDCGRQQQSCCLSSWQRAGRRMSGKKWIGKWQK